MIHHISSTLATFREIAFQPGLNLVVSEKSPGATDLQTRNSSGKSSLIEIIHFLLGASCDKSSIFRRDSIIDEAFTISMDLGSERLEAVRSGVTQGRIVLDEPAHTWPVQPKV